MPARRFGAAEQVPAHLPPVENVIPEQCVAPSLKHPGATLRIAPGQPDASGIYVRMRARGDDRQMPPLATERADDDGLSPARAWILALPVVN